MFTCQGKLRIRSCGVLVENEAVLLVQLRSPISNQLIWMPPGGGVRLGETIQEALKREFEEETGLEIEVDHLVYINELVESRIQAIEFYFRVTKISGKLRLGSDPEYNDDDQILKEIMFIPIAELPGHRIVPEYFKKDFWDNGNAARLNSNFL